MKRDEIISIAQANGFDVNKSDIEMLSDPAFFKAAFRGRPDEVSLYTHGSCPCGSHYAAEAKQTAWINKFVVASMYLDNGDVDTAWKEISVSSPTLFPGGVFDKAKARSVLPRINVNFAAVVPREEVALDHVRQIADVIEQVLAKYPGVDVSLIKSIIEKVRLK